MRTSRTRLAAVAAVAVLGIAVAASETSASGRASTVPPAEGPVGAACADIPTDGAADRRWPATSRTAGNNPDLSTFVRALDEAGLSAALDLEGPFTVFVPNNAAFAKIPQNVLDSILADSALLNSILVYHVVSGAALAPADLVAAGSVETAHGAPLAVTQDGDDDRDQRRRGNRALRRHPGGQRLRVRHRLGPPAAERRCRCRRQHERGEQHTRCDRRGQLDSVGSLVELVGNGGGWDDANPPAVRPRTGYVLGLLERRRTEFGQPMETEDDAAALMVRVAGGDHGAFAALYDQLAPLVFGVSKRVLHDPSLCRGSHPGGVPRDLAPGATLRRQPRLGPGVGGDDRQTTRRRPGAQRAGPPGPSTAPMRQSPIRRRRRPTRWPSIVTSGRGPRPRSGS